MAQNSDSSTHVIGLKMPITAAPEPSNTFFWLLQSPAFMWHRHRETAQIQISNKTF